MDTISTRTADSSSLSISTIGEDLTITGNVTSKGELQLNGQIQGDIHCIALVVGENARKQGLDAVIDTMQELGEEFGEDLVNAEFHLEKMAG